MDDPDFDLGMPAASAEEDYIGTFDETENLRIVTSSAIRTVEQQLRLIDDNPNRAIDARATTVPELGSKARVVTAAPAEWVVVGDACRIESEPRINLSGRHT